MIEIEKIHSVLTDLKNESFEVLYDEIKNSYGDIFHIEDFLSYFRNRMGGKNEYSLYADFLNYYFSKEDEK